MEASSVWVAHAIASFLVFASPGGDEEKPPIQRAPSQEDIPRLRKQLTDPDPAVRFRAALYFSSANLGPEAKRAVPDLILLLKDDRSDIRRAAASAIGILGCEVSAIPELVKALKDSDAFVRGSIVGALGGLGKAAEAATEEVTKLLGDEDPNVRVSAALSLWQLTRQATKSMPVLRKLLADKDSSVRWGAMEHLGMMGKDATPLVDDIKRSLDDKSPTLRCVAAEALWRITGNGSLVLPTLQKLVQNEEEREEEFEAFDPCSMALGSLSDMGREAKTAIPQMLPLMKSENPKHRCSAAKALWRINRDTEATIPVLSKILEDQDLDKTVRENAVNVLGEMEAKAAGELPKLKKLLHHESLMMRTAAEKAVERIEKASAHAKDKG